MRISVLTGVLACTLLLNSVPVSALETVPAIAPNGQSEFNIIPLTVDVSGLKEIVKIEVEKSLPVQEPEAVVHEVVTNESLSDIATLHETTWKKLYDKNTAIDSPDIINPGDEIVIPAVDEVVEPRELPVVVLPPAPVVKSSRKSTGYSAPISTTRAVSARGSSDGNRYTAGYCTWYVKNKRPDMPNNLGNAATWVSRAAGQGMATGSAPRVGAVGQRGNHVVYVESVNADGTVTISEMNHKGLWVQTTRTLPASYFTYIY